MADRILVVDDDAGVCWALGEVLRTHGFTVDQAGDADAALAAIRRQAPQLVITDVRMPGISGLDLLDRLHRERPALPVVVTTAYGSIDIASIAVARGAFDYLPKPLDLDRTLGVVERALGRRDLAIEVAPAGAVEPTLVGSAPAMQEVFRRLALAAPGDLPVLVTGPTGSGKDLAARLLHRHGDRAQGPFVVANCAAMATPRAADELTAVVDAAEGGTLLLDEVGDLPPGAQAALLRRMDGGLGRLRLVSTCNRDPAGETGLRQDLLHRLAVVTLAMPSILGRPGDLPVLTAHLLARIAGRLGRRLALTEAALVRLGGHDWPGNVRELRHVLEEAVALTPGGVIDAEHLRLAGGSAAPAAEDLPQLARRLLDEHPGQAHARWTDRCEAVLLSAALERSRGNLVRGAELLGLHRSTLRKRARDLGLLAVRTDDPEEGEAG